MNKEEILEKVGFDLDKAKQIHSWLNEKPATESTESPCATTERKPVSIHYDKDGKADGVLIQTLDESFVLALHDAEGGKQMNWNDAMKKHRMPTQKQWLMVMLYFDEVQECLVQAGGEKLKDDDGYWSSSEFNSNYAWYVYFSGFNSVSYGKLGSGYVRAVAAS